MKEYTYTNKAYLGIKEGVVPPAPQYLWLNSKDDKLYKFGDNGWESINNTDDGSRYIIRNFTLDDILNGIWIRVSSELADAIKKERPLAIYEERNGKLYNIDAVIASFSPITEITFIIHYNNMIRVNISSSYIVEDGKYISALPMVNRVTKVSEIRNANGDSLLPSINGGVDVSAGFFADKSVEYSENNTRTTLVTINKQVTILEKPLMGDGKFRLSPPLRNTAVEYTVRFRVGAQCSWSITNMDNRLLPGIFYERNLTDIPVGVYLMKITLYSFVNSNGDIQTEYFTEIKSMVSK